MTTNPYFQFHTSNAEQSLVENLIIEAIAAMGMDCFYLPRGTAKLDNILGEDVLSHFNERYEIEAYVKSVEGWQGEGSLFRKFGWEIRDQMTLNIAKSRFNSVLGDAYNRPREGDLIFFPLTNTLFQIVNVTQDQLFFQLGSLHMYEIKVELFQYNQQPIDTGIPEIDNIGTNFSYSTTLTVESGSGTYVPGEFVYQGTDYASATASAEVVTWDPKTLKITNTKGIFIVSTAIKGQSSLAEYNIASIDDQLLPEDALADNKEITEEAAAIVDFSEENPFSEKF